MSRSWSVEVDRDTCIGSGMCVDYAPGTFDQDEEAKSFVIATSNDPVELVSDAVDACPTRALTLKTQEIGV